MGPAVCFAEQVTAERLGRLHLPEQLAVQGGAHMAIKDFLDGILRQELGFDGVIISDDMQMGALADHYTFEETIYLAIQAGVDILAFANNSVYEEEIVPRALAVIKELVQENLVSEARIDRSYQRIQRLKSRLLA